MSSFTRQAIMDSFLRLLLKKPFRKVTVRDIVEECGVNRTTFYYSYQDIYAIVEDLISSTLAPYAASLLGEAREEDLRDTGDFIRLYRRALTGLWDGLGEAEIRRYVFSVIDGPLAAFLEKEGEGLALAPSRLLTVRLLLRETLYGFFYLLFRGEIAVGTEELETATRGMVRRALENMANKEKGGEEK